MRHRRLLRFWSILPLGGIIVLMLAPSVRGSSRPADDASAKFCFRLSVGAGLFLDGGGDLDKARLGSTQFYTDLGGEPGYTSIANWKKMSLVPDFEADAIFPVGRNIGLGLGAGYIRGTSKGNYGYTYTETDSSTAGSYLYSQKADYTRNYTISAIPIRITLFLTIPSGRLNFFGYLGAGFYLGTLDHAYQARTLETLDIYSAVDAHYEVKDVTDGTENVKKNALGFHGGFGVDWKLGASLALSLEVFGRYASFSKWEGDYSETRTIETVDPDSGRQTVTDKYGENGSLYYYEVFDSYFQKYYGEMYVYSSPQDIANLKNMREAGINLNAFGVRLSLKFFFNIAL